MGAAVLVVEVRADTEGELVAGVEIEGAELGLRVPRVLRVEGVEVSVLIAGVVTGAAGLRASPKVKGAVVVGAPATVAEAKGAEPPKENPVPVPVLVLVLVEGTVGKGVVVAGLLIAPNIPLVVWAGCAV